jgi:hypothetical protein
MSVEMTGIRKAGPETTGWIGFWQVVCQALLDGAATEAQLGWIERRVADLPTLQMWLEFRENCLKHDPRGDPEDVQGVLALDVRETPTWRRVVECGFRRTAARVHGARRRQVMRELAAILYNPDLLSELETTVYSADQLSEAWAQIDADARRD